MMATTYRWRLTPLGLRERPRRQVARRASAAAVVAVAALAAGGCGTSSNPAANLYRIPNMTSQTLMSQLEQPTSPGPGGYPVLAGPQHLSLHGIQYTTQGRDALQTWLNTSPTKHASYQQAGRNLAVAFPSDKAEIEGKLG